MKIYKITEILDNANRLSPFYHEAFKGCSLKDLSEIPIVSQEKFWKTEVLTNKKPGGIVFKSGGSSGMPKYSYFTHEEWITFTKYFGKGMSDGILEDGDKIANLFYAGDMYASFLFIKDSLQWIDTEKMNVSQYPISGATDFANILKTFEEFAINVACGVPSQILKLLEFYESNKNDFKKINIAKILFGGESLYPDQELAIKEILPNVIISSIGCASVDGGLLGFSTKDCLIGEHRVFDEATIIEIVDEVTNEVILEKNRVGKVILTNLTRKLMPIIRYPAGDLAMWIEESGIPNRKFKLCGRSDEAARLGTISVYFEDTRSLISNTLKEINGIQFQIILKHFANKDEMIFRIAGHNLNHSTEICNKVLNAFIKEKQVYSDILNKNLIHPLKIEVVPIGQLETNSRTGKLKRVIDMRFN